MTLSRWPCLFRPYTSTGRRRKRTHDIVRIRVGDVDPSIMVHLTCVVISLGGQGEIIHGLKRQPAAPTHADVQSHLPSSSAIQSLAVREEIGTVAFLMRTQHHPKGKVKNSERKTSFISESLLRIFVLLFCLSDIHTRHIWHIQ